MNSGSTTITLDELPTEVLFSIFDYFPPRILYFTLRVVCKRFALLLSRDKYFKVRFRKKYLQGGIEFPLLKHYGLIEETNHWKSGQEISWTDIAVRSDLRENIFGNKEDKNGNFNHKIHGLPHTATVDTVHLFDNGRLCVSGGRDRLLCLWNIIEGIPVTHQSDAHNGWIWDIKGHEQDTFFTCGWDSAVNHWALSSGIKLIQKLPTERAMCLSTEPGLLAVGLQNGKIVLMDPRIGNVGGAHENKLHKGAVTGIHIWKNQIVSIGEDRKMGVYDIRNQEILAHRHVNCVLRTCPRSIGVYRDILYIGDSKGYLSIFDMKSDFKPLICSKVGEQRAINALIPSLEGLILGTSDVGLRFVVPSAPFRTVGEYDLSGEVTSIDFKNNTLVAGCTNSIGCVHIFQGYKSNH